MRLYNKIFIGMACLAFSALLVNCSSDNNTKPAIPGDENVKEQVDPDQVADLGPEKEKPSIRLKVVDTNKPQDGRSIEVEVLDPYGEYDKFIGFVGSKDGHTQFTYMGTTQGDQPILSVYSKKDEILVMHYFNKDQADGMLPGKLFVYQYGVLPAGSKNWGMHLIASDEMIQALADRHNFKKSDMDSAVSRYYLGDRVSHDYSSLEQNWEVFLMDYQDLEAQQ